MDPTSELSRRERQIMQVIFARGSATAKEIVEEIPNPPSRTAVRTMLTILVDKDLITHERVGREFVYSPRASREKASRGALKSLLATFFGGSIENLIASHFSDPDSELDAESLERIREMILETKSKSTESAPKSKEGSATRKKKKSTKRGSRKGGKQ